MDCLKSSGMYITACWVDRQPKTAGKGQDETSISVQGVKCNVQNGKCKVQNVKKRGAATSCSTLGPGRQSLTVLAGMNSAGQVQVQLLPSLGFARDAVQCVIQRSLPASRSLRSGRQNLRAAYDAAEPSIVAHLEQLKYKYSTPRIIEVLPLCT